MEDFETKEQKLKKLFLEFFRKIKEKWNLHVEYRVHGGNQINEVITELSLKKIKGKLSIFLLKSF